MAMLIPSHGCPIPAFPCTLLSSATHKFVVYALLHTSATIALEEISTGTQELRLDNDFQKGLLQYHEFVQTTWEETLGIDREGIAHLWESKVFTFQQGELQTDRDVREASLQVSSHVCDANNLNCLSMAGNDGYFGSCVFWSFQ